MKLNIIIISLCSFCCHVALAENISKDALAKENLEIFSHICGGNEISNNVIDHYDDVSSASDIIDAKIVDFWHKDSGKFNVYFVRVLKPKYIPYDKYRNDFYIFYDGENWVLLNDENSFAKLLNASFAGKFDRKFCLNIADVYFKVYNGKAFWGVYQDPNFKDKYIEKWPDAADELHELYSRKLLDLPWEFGENKFTFYCMTESVFLKVKRVDVEMINGRIFMHVDNVLQ